MTPEDEIRGLNVHLASMRRALHERESELEALTETIARLSIGGLTPAQVTEKLRDLEQQAERGRAAAEKLAAYEGQMLYRVEAFDSDSFYCAPEAIVVKHGEQVCGCDSMAEAAKIAAALNRLPPEIDNVG